MTYKAHQAFISAILLATLTACASTADDSRQIRVTSIPSGLPVTTDVGLTCAATPCQISVPALGAVRVSTETVGHTKSVIVPGRRIGSRGKELQTVVLDLR